HFETGSEALQLLVVSLEQDRAYVRSRPRVFDPSRTRASECRLTTRGWSLTLRTRASPRAARLVAWVLRLDRAARGVDRDFWAAWLIGMDGGLGAPLTEDAANGATGGG